MIRLEWLALLALIACVDHAAPIDDYVAPSKSDAAPVAWRLVIDPSVDSKMVDDILDAADAWVAATAGTPCPVSWATIEREPSREIRAGVVAVRVVPLDEATRGELGHAEWNDSGARIVLRDRGADTPGLRREFKVTARHELGHAFGLGHRDDGVMRPGPTNGIAKTDVDAYVTQWCGR